MKGYYARRGSDLGTRLLAMSVDGENGCREWIAWLNQSNYGRLALSGHRKVMAHRAAYEFWVGPIPDGMTVDHLCFNRRCINPGHLRLLSHADNSANQQSALATHCQRGHEFTPDNLAHQTGGRRRCRTCQQDRSRMRAKAAREAAAVA